MLDALEKSLGIVTSAAKAAGIDRATHYKWMQKDKKYRDAVNEICDIAVDFAETQLHKKMKDGSDAAIIFYLKTKGKSRGYIERSEFHLDMPPAPPQTVNIHPVVVAGAPPISTDDESDA